MSSKLTLGLTIGAALATSFSSSTSQARKQIGSIDTSIAKLQKQKVNIKQFQQLSRDGDQGSKAINKLGRALVKAGVDVRDLDNETRRVNQSLSILMRTKKLDLGMGKITQELKQAKAEILAIVGYGYSLKKLYGSASTTIKAQGEIKTLGISDAGVNDITKSGHQMAMEFGQITAPEYIRASYDIKSGIASLTESGVNNYTKLAATTAIATKSTVGEMTKLYALGYGIFRKDFASDDEFGAQFSGGIAAAVQAFRTDGSDLSQGFSNIGASASSMGVTLAEQLSIIGVAKSSFNSASEAGTSYRSFLENVGKAEQELNVQLTDSQGKMLPMVEILDALSAKFDNLEDVAQSDALKSAFGSAEAVKLIKGLIEKTDELRDSQQSLQKAMQGGASQAQQMADMAQQGHGIERLGNAFSYLGYTFGKVLEPVFNGLASSTAVVANGIAWVDSHVSWLIPSITGLTLGIGAVIVAVKTWRLASLGLSFVKLLLIKELNIFRLAMLSNVFAMKAYALGSTVLSGTMRVLGSALRFVGTSIAWVGRALLMNPIGLAVTAIGLAAFAVYKYWEPIKGFFSGLWAQVKTAFSGGLSGIGALILNWSPLGLFYKAFSGVLGWFGISLPETFTGFGGKIVGALMDGIKSLLPDVSGLLNSIPIPDWVRNKLGIGAVDIPQQGLNIEYTQPEPKKVQTALRGRPAMQNDIKITVNNPASTVEVEQAITSAMGRQFAGVPLVDMDY
ncbi:MAG: phage tail tape measure protein [Shewanella sp.]